MSNITIRPMEPEDWNAVSEIYLEGIATEHATFQTTCPPYTAWDAFHIKECRLVILDGGELAGWAALRRGDPLCDESEKEGYWTLHSTVLQDNTASLGLHTKCGFRVVGRRERIARDCHGRWLDTYLMERRAKADEPAGYKKL